MSYLLAVHGSPLLTFVAQRSTLYHLLCVVAASYIHACVHVHAGVNWERSCTNVNLGVYIVIFLTENNIMIGTCIVSMYMHAYTIDINVLSGKEVCMHG